MPKYPHLQSMKEQITDKGYGSAPFHYEQAFGVTGVLSEDIPSKIIVDDSSIQSLAYEIHRLRGGTCLDNWLEAERTLTHNF